MFILVSGLVLSKVILISPVLVKNLLSFKILVVSESLSFILSDRFRIMSRDFFSFSGSTERSDVSG